MGIGTGLPCCGCRVRKWRIAMTANHGYYGTRTPREFDLVGTAAGFDWTTVSDGYLGAPANLVGSRIKLTNLGGNDWRFEIEQNGIGEESIDFTYNFVSGYYDVEVEFSVNDSIKQVVTIMDYDVARPTDFLWFPNRSPQNTIRLVYNTFPISPVVLPGRRTVFTGLMTRSTDANYVYWDATLDGDTVRIRADKQTGKVSVSQVFNSGTPSTNYVSVLEYVAWPFHLSLFYANNYNFNPSSAYDGFIYDENEPALVEVFNYSELMLSNETGTTYRSEQLVKEGYALDFNRRAQQQVNILYRTAAKDVFFDSTDLDARLGLTTGTQYLIVGPSVIAGAENATVVLGAISGFQIYWSSAAVCSLDANGRFTGTAVWNYSPPVNVAVDGRIVPAHLPSALWPSEDEDYAFSGVLEYQKIWLPEYFAQGRNHDDAAYDWMLSKDQATKIYGKPMFTWGSTGGYIVGFPPVLQTPAITIYSGSLPAGMTIYSLWGQGPLNELFLQGTPTQNETGTVRFKINDYISKTYNWKVGTGASFTIVYPDPFTNNGTPPSGGFDWHIDGTTMVLTPLSIAATITGGTGPYTCTLHSGTLPPSALLNATTGEIYTVGISPLDPSETGSCVIKCVDSLAAECFSLTYNWEYIGT